MQVNFVDNKNIFPVYMLCIKEIILNGGAVMYNKNSAEHLCFELFLDAIKRKDKSQFVYYNMYFNIAHCEDNLVQEKSQGEELSL